MCYELISTLIGHFELPITIENIFRDDMKDIFAKKLIIENKNNSNNVNYVNQE